MTAKLTQDAVEKRLHKIGYQLHSLYRDAKSPIDVTCNRGHRFTTTWDSVKTGRCGYCARNIKLSESDYMAIGIQNGFKWVGKVLPDRNSSDTEWLCQEGHIFTRPYARFYHHQDHSCPVCTKRRRHTPQTYRELANQIGIEWLGPMPKTLNNHTNWKCQRGHVYSTSYKSVSHNGRFHACQQCKNDTFIGTGHPRWKGTELLGKHLGRLRRQNKINITPTGDALTKEQWKYSKQYFDYNCAYCGNPVARPHKDHFYPVCKGGPHTAGNIIPSCRECNQAKNRYHPIEWVTDYFGLERGADIYHSIRVYFNSLT